MRQLKVRFLQLRYVLCLRDFLREWHIDADHCHILRGNVERFVARGYFEQVGAQCCCCRCWQCWRWLRSAGPLQTEVQSRPQSAAHDTA